MLGIVGWLCGSRIGRWLALVVLVVVAAGSASRETATGFASLALLVMGPVMIGHLLWRYERAVAAERVALLWLGLSCGAAALVFGVLAFAAGC